MKVYTPKQDRVILKKLDEEKNKESLIIRPETAAEENVIRGKVIAKGPGLWLDGKQIPVNAEIGEVVLFNKIGAIPLEKEKLFLVREFEILCGIEDAPEEKGA